MMQATNPREQRTLSRSDDLFRIWIVVAAVATAAGLFLWMLRA